MRHTLITLAVSLVLSGPAGAIDPTPPATTLNLAGEGQAKRGCDLALKHEYTQAYAVLQRIVDRSTTDMAARACYAIAMSGMGLHEQARQEMSIVLSWKPSFVEGYVVRAISAAEMGATRQAKHDLDIARQLDPQDTLKAIGNFQQRIDTVLGLVPKEPAVQLHAELLKAAREGKAIDQLSEIAVKLLKASNAERRLGDETYSETKRQLMWAAGAHPKDADRLAAVGRFLVDEIDARGDSVEPTRFMIYYRQQGKALKEAELKQARQIFNQALTLIPHHVPSLAGLARMEITVDMWANAERYLRRAIATGTTDREVLKLMSDVMRAAAAQRLAAAIPLLMTRQWDEKYGNMIYSYVRRPSAEDLAKAHNYDVQAGNLYGIASGYIKKALTTLSNDAASHDFVGSMAYAAKDYPVAAKSWEKAVKLDPVTRHYHYSLANAYSKQNHVEAYMEQATIGRNLEHTTAGTQLDGAWDLIASGRLDEAAGFLDKAVSVDPGDARTIAYMAVIAEAQGKRDEALPLYRAAYALEEAHARQRGGSWLRNIGYWYVNDTGRAIELRSRMAEMVHTQHPQQALDLYLQNVKIESGFPDAALKEQVHTAMFPLPNLAVNRRQVPPTFGELMRTNRALAAVELAGLGQCDKAAEHFRKLLDYDGRAKTGGANAYQRPRDGLWKTHRVAAAAVKCFEKVSDQQQLYGWRNFFSRAPADSDSRRFSPTESGTRGKGGWRKY
jgi:tetratricopeptide (TPR) repeat protein